VHIGNALQHLFRAVLLQGMHAFFKSDGQQLGDARMFLNGLLDQVGADQQLVKPTRPR
jgi:hypothetical protein